MITIAQLQSERERLIAYLYLKIEKRDWHGVADGCMDLREVEVQINLLEEYKIGRPESKLE